MLRMMVAAVVAAALAVPAATAFATSFSTDAWSCGYSGSTYPSGTTIYAYTAEDLPYDCSTQVVLEFDYKLNGVCHYNSLQYVSDWFVGNSQASASGAVSHHQIYVPGHGYGPLLYTYYPTDGVC